MGEKDLVKFATVVGHPAPLKHIDQRQCAVVVSKQHRSFPTAVSCRFEQILILRCAVSSEYPLHLISASARCPYGLFTAKPISRNKQIGSLNDLLR